MTKEEFGAHLQSLLELRGLSQKRLSMLTGIRESTISDWINGKYYPKQDKRVLIAKALNIPPDRLFALMRMNHQQKVTIGRKTNIKN